MGTKNNPGDYDCYAKADPDEPIFTLRANDPCAPATIRQWVANRANSSKGIHGDMAVEALDCADAMEQWYQENVA